jgi:hypothetical protein
MTQDRVRTDHAALSDRLRYLLGLRFALAAITVGFGLASPATLGVPVETLAGVTVAYLGVAVALEWLGHRLPSTAFATLTVMLLVDGVYLAAAMYATGGTQSPMRFLIYLHLVAVSLLASYRTGLKIALWHSLLLFVVLYAQAAALLPPVDVQPGRAIGLDGIPALNVTAFWLFALATSLFSAMNERELRQRRADLEALVRVGAELDDEGDPLQQAQLVRPRSLTGTVPARRSALCLGGSPPGAGDPRDRCACRRRVARRRSGHRSRVGGARAPRPAPDPRGP